MQISPGGTESWLNRRVSDPSSPGPGAATSPCMLAGQLKRLEALWFALLRGVKKKKQKHTGFMSVMALYVCCFPSGLLVKNPTTNAEDVGLIPGLGRSPGEGNGNPLLYSSLETPMDRGGWRATVHGVTKNLLST